MQRKSLFCANTDVFINIWSRTANKLKLTLNTVDSSGSKIGWIKCKKCWLYMITAASTVFQKLWPLWMQCAVECLVVAQQFVLLYYRAREGKQPHRLLSLTLESPSQSRKTVCSKHTICTVCLESLIHSGKLVHPDSFCKRTDL